MPDTSIPPVGLGALQPPTPAAVTAMGSSSCLLSSAATHPGVTPLRRGVWPQEKRQIAVLQTGVFAPWAAAQELSPPGGLGHRRSLAPLLVPVLCPARISSRP